MKKGTTTYFLKNKAKVAEGISASTDWISWELKEFPSFTVSDSALMEGEDRSMNCNIRQDFTLSGGATANNIDEQIRPAIDIYHCQRLCEDNILCRSFVFINPKIANFIPEEFSITGTRANIDTAGIVGKCNLKNKRVGDWQDNIQDGQVQLTVEMGSTYGELLSNGFSIAPIGKECYDIGLEIVRNKDECLEGWRGLNSYARFRKDPGSTVTLRKTHACDEGSCCNSTAGIMYGCSVHIEGNGIAAEQLGDPHWKSGGKNQCDVYDKSMVTSGEFRAICKGGAGPPLESVEKFKDMYFVGTEVKKVERKSEISEDECLNMAFHSGVAPCNGGVNNPCSAAVVYKKSDGTYGCWIGKNAMLAAKPGSMEDSTFFQKRTDVFKLYNNYAVEGGTKISNKGSIGSAEDCWKECEGSATCKSAAYAHPNYSGGGSFAASTCYLHSNDIGTGVKITFEIGKLIQYMERNRGFLIEIDSNSAGGVQLGSGGYAATSLEACWELCIEWNLAASEDPTKGFEDMCRSAIWQNGEYIKPFAFSLM